MKETRKKDLILEMLQNPPEEAKGWTRWWWYGCAVTHEEIIRELHFMKEAGLGGAEIAILYPLAADDEKKRIFNIPFYSPEFFEILDFTLTEAKKLGLGIDFTLGSSWPYGGPFVPQDMAPQMVTTWQIDVTGPVDFFSYDFTTLIEGEIVGVAMGRMENSTMIPESLMDITGYLQDKMLYGWPWGKELVNVPVSKGNWKIVAFVSESYRQTVAIPTRGAGGYAIDHCRQDVTDFFLKNAAEPLLERLGKNRIRCFFCDSIELGGNNWTQYLPEEFRKRRGYELTPYLYGLVGEVGEIAERIRYDYYLTMSELTLENFFERFTSWCEDHEMKSRIQAHGTWADILKAYALADIPEGESFGPQDKLHVNTIQRRLATSAAHIYGRKIVSNESFTWLRVPRFLVNYENVKAAADAIFLDGMNAIVNHGYAYSPEEAGVPGWAFYASSNLNHTNPAWDCYKEVGDYIQRMSAVFRQGYVRNDVAIYLPQGDVWSQTPIANLHMGMRLQEYLQWGVPDRIAREGYSFDYVNDEALTSLGIMENGLKIGENVYKVILLIGCKRLPLETAKALDQFVKNGGLLLAADGVPDDSCGMYQWKEQSEKVKEIMAQLFPEEMESWQGYGKGAVAKSADRTEKMLHLLREKRQPDACIGPKTAAAGYLHHKVGEEDFYFLANISEKTEVVSVAFSQMGQEFCVYDCVTARPRGVKAVTAQNQGITVELELKAFDSVLVVFGKGRCYLKEVREQTTGILEVKGWTLTALERKVRLDMETPVFWQKFPELRDFCGKGSYKAVFELSQLDQEKVYLQLEGLADTARVFVNEKPAGIIWKRPWKLDITDTVISGKNQIRLVCTGPLINSVLDPSQEPEYYPGTLMDGWPYFTESINQIRKRRIGKERERRAIKEPVNMGLEGSVKILMVCAGASEQAVSQ